MTADRYFELKDTIKMLCDTLPQIDPEFRFREPIRNTNNGQIEKIKMCYRIKMELIKERIDRGLQISSWYSLRFLISFRTISGTQDLGYSSNDVSLRLYP